MSKGTSTGVASMMYSVFGSMGLSPALNFTKSGKASCIKNLLKLAHFGLIFKWTTSLRNSLAMLSSKT